MTFLAIFKVVVTQHIRVLFVSNNSNIMKKQTNLFVNPTCYIISFNQTYWLQQFDFKLNIHPCVLHKNAIFILEKLIDYCPVYC